jgi:transcription elongation GreA/GreB family factor
MQNKKTSDGGHRESDPSVVDMELFSGKVTVGEAIERLRTRLLDLSARNRLLNYNHPAARSIQIADEPDLDEFFERLNGELKGVPFNYLSEPNPDSYEGKRPEPRTHAPHIGVSVSLEGAQQTGGRASRSGGMQTLLYPADLERKLRKINSDAKTAVEETGSNLLFLIFGFLEFYDSEDSEKPLLAPLLSLPVTLNKGEIDQDTRTYRYSAQHNGEDLAENHTLREKLRRDFVLSLPEFEEGDTVGKFFARVESAITKKRRWKVRCQLTLGMLSFGKLAIWADLDTKKNPELIEHNLISAVFSGNGSESGTAFHAPDYPIDERAEAIQPLIYDADSSQHSAIIDVLAGKNLVVNGPPGTGKSQTITNIIAAALSSGKKVLFVSEKLAALEVVRHRLSHAGLGHFCLELHSHKTQKKTLLDDIQARIEHKFTAPAQFQSKLATLSRQKTQLARYAELMGSSVGNCLGLTANEIFWAVERRRQELGDVGRDVRALAVPDAPSWTQDDLQLRMARLNAVANLFEAIRQFNKGHPWWGFTPGALVPADDEAISRTVELAFRHAKLADEAAGEAINIFLLPEQPDVVTASASSTVLAELPDFPLNADAGLLTRMFADSDSRGMHSSQVLGRIASEVAEVRGLLSAASTVLADGIRLRSDDVEQIRKSLRRANVADELSGRNLSEIRSDVLVLERAVAAFDSASRAADAPYKSTNQQTLDKFRRLAETAEFEALGRCTPEMIRTRVAAVGATVASLSQALTRIQFVADRRDIKFDATPDAVARLAGPAGIPGLIAGQSISQEVVSKAAELARSAFGGTALVTLVEIAQRLDLLTEQFEDALGRASFAVERLGLTFQWTDESLAEADTLLRVASSAPGDLLDLRAASLGQSKTADFVAKMRSAIAAELSERSALEGIFYVDSVPANEDVRAAVSILRQKDGFGGLLDGRWRKARKLHSVLSREKRKVSTRQRADELARLLAWHEAKESFNSDSELKDWFGPLFCGLDTDVSKIESLATWYSASRTSMLKCPGLVGKVNLTTVAADRILEVAAKADALTQDLAKLRGSDVAVGNLLNSLTTTFIAARETGWEDGLSALRSAGSNIKATIEFFRDRVELSLSPTEGSERLAAKLELDDLAAEFTLLSSGRQSLQDAAGSELRPMVVLKEGRWPNELLDVSERIREAAELADVAVEFASDAVPISAAASFVARKVGLESAWSAVGTMPQQDVFCSWAEMIACCRDVVCATQDALVTIVPACRTDVTLSAFFDAAETDHRGHEMLANLSASNDVIELLGPNFVGETTDLNHLFDTHAWGCEVAAAKLPSQVRAHLLSNQAIVVLDSARRIYGAISQNFRIAQDAMLGLAMYGDFVWTDWLDLAAGDSTLTPSMLRAKLAMVQQSAGSLMPWSKYLVFRKLALSEGLKDFVEAMESGKIDAQVIAKAFELASFESIGRTIYQSHPELANFDGDAHSLVREGFRSLDVEIVSIAGKDFAAQISRNTRVPEGYRGTTAGDFTEMQLLRREINKQRRHIPIRQLLKRAGRALQELKPCFMMGPLSVAQYLEQGALEFDLVVMDEASQLRPEEALGAIARGAQLVVVGDPKQLPPTNFFDRMVDSTDEDDEDASAATTGMESILDICQQLFTPVRSLRWHYRSQHESLIAFSNHHFYKNLVVFPSPYANSGRLGVKYRYVRNGVYQDRQNLPEAQRVVDAVLQHMLKHPEESLGVVTLNQTQRELIEELLDKKLKFFDEGAEFIDKWASAGWPFFVKNLENVQGDERDVIFISTTFGKAAGTDKVRQNFGPISRAAGWRRLNVLFTRSKRRIELFTSMVAEDIIVDEKSPLGTRALRDYLDFAKRGVLVTTDAGVREPDSDFEISVANVITSLGYEVKPQLGVAGYFIDIAVRNPDRPGEFLAAIECDGATYHSGISVRDRDRIRQDILESLGWKRRIYRIWSTDWFHNPREATQRLRAFLEERRRVSEMEASANAESEADDDLDIVVDDETAATESIEPEVSGVADIIVEVGDRVTYCLVDDSSERHSVLIVDSEGNARMAIINERSPLAQALLGLGQGDVGTLHAPGQKAREIRVLAIRRQAEFLS